MAVCNESATLIGDEAVANEVPIYGNYTFHHLFLAITAVFSMLGTLIALALMYLHGTHYSVPHQQRHILRIIFMIPVYAVISLISYVYFQHAIYWAVLRDCYEAFAIASFFTLLCCYLEEDLHNLKERFRKLGPHLKNWVWPFNWMQKCSGGRDRGPFRVPRSGLTWFNIIYVGIYSYCFIRVVFTFVAMVSELFHRYCETSLNPAFAHVWVMSFEAASVTVAMYCLIQFYVQMKDDLKEWKPFLKVCCIKLVIFFSFWQSIVISFLSSSGTLKPSEKIANPDIQIGIPSLLLSIEMFIFAIVHIFAFPWKPYVLPSPNSPPNVDSFAGVPVPPLHYQGGTLGWKAWLDAFNLWDVVKAAARGMRWLFVGRKRRHLDSSYETARNTKFEPGGTAYQGAAAYKAAAMEDQEMGIYPAPGAAPMAGRGRLGTPGEDQKGLLSHAQANPRSPGLGSSPDFGSAHGQPGGWQQQRPNDPPTSNPYQPSRLPYPDSDGPPYPPDYTAYPQQSRPGRR